MNNFVDTPVEEEEGRRRTDVGANLVPSFSSMQIVRDPAGDGKPSLLSTS